MHNWHHHGKRFSCKLLELGAARARPRHLRVRLVPISQIIERVARVRRRGRGGHRCHALRALLVPNNLNLVGDNNLAAGQVGLRVRLGDFDVVKLALKVVPDLSVNLVEVVVVLVGPHILSHKNFIRLQILRKCKSCLLFIRAFSDTYEGDLKPAFLVLIRKVVQAAASLLTRLS